MPAFDDETFGDEAFGDETFRDVKYVTECQKKKCVFVVPVCLPFFEECR